MSHGLLSGPAFLRGRPSKMSSLAPMGGKDGFTTMDLALMVALGATLAT